MKKILMAICALLLTMSAQAQQVKYTVKGVSKDNGKMVSDYNGSGITTPYIAIGVFLSARDGSHFLPSKQSS